MAVSIEGKYLKDDAYLKKPGQFQLLFTAQAHISIPLVHFTLNVVRVPGRGCAQFMHSREDAFATLPIRGMACHHVSDLVSVCLT
jgi:hypothetical protein